MRAKGAGAGLVGAKRRSDWGIFLGFRIDAARIRNGQI
jgi:hypothetical protein